MFYYFRRKEDLLAELLDRTVQPTLAYIDWLARQRGPAEVKLFELIGNDVQNICSGSYNLTALYLLPEAKAERFAEFWDKRGRLSSYYQHVIASGRRSRAPSPRLSLPIRTTTSSPRPRTCSQPSATQAPRRATLPAWPACIDDSLRRVSHAEERIR